MEPIVLPAEKLLQAVLYFAGSAYEECFCGASFGASAQAILAILIGILRVYLVQISRNTQLHSIKHRYIGFCTGKQF
jgi:hypothetical protein